MNRIVKLLNRKVGQRETGKKHSCVNNNNNNNNNKKKNEVHKIIMNYIHGIDVNHF